MKAFSEIIFVDTTFYPTLKNDYLLQSSYKLITVLGNVVLPKI